jgi:nitrogen fixation protein NifU and related proteins
MRAAGGYDGVLMDHIKNARNYRVLEELDREATGVNPLCGDEVAVRLKLDRGHVRDAAFQCTCCGIAMASASIMTEFVKALPLDTARPLVRAFIEALYGNAELPEGCNGQGQRALVATARDFPTRLRCAALPWATVEAALEGSGDAVYLR